jgi:galactokinase
VSGSSETLPARIAASGTAGAELLERCAAALAAQHVEPERTVQALWVPGRIEVLGKHTDYGGGRSLLAATERGIRFLSAARGDGRVVVVDAVSGERDELAMDPDLAADVSGWAKYPRAVVRRVARNFASARTGVTVAFASDLPSAAGLSSSTALIVGVFLALSEANRLYADPRYRASVRTVEDLADYLAAVENGSDFRALAGDLGVGTRGGSQDHTAILCSRPDALVQYRFAPLARERIVPLPSTHCFAVACSGVRAEKTGEALGRYNRAAAQLRSALDAWCRATGRDDATLGAVLRSGPDASERLLRLVESGAAPDGDAATLASRVRQFIAESREIVPAAADALAAGRFSAFGALVDRSQHLAEEALGNQLPETVFLARSARERGAVAASAFGAGFGGSVWALVEARGAEALLDRWRQEYLARFPEHASNAEFFLTRAARPAGSLL